VPPPQVALQNLFLSCEFLAHATRVWQNPADKKTAPPNHSRRYLHIAARGNKGEAARKAQARQSQKRFAGIGAPTNLNAFRPSHVDESLLVLSNATFAGQAIYGQTTAFVQLLSLSAAGLS